jgi:tetratricopeptide (TPR) repeat protein
MEQNGQTPASPGQDVPGAEPVKSKTTPVATIPSGNWIIIGAITLFLVFILSIPPLRRIALDTWSYHIVDGFHSLSDTKYFFEKGVRYSEQQRTALSLRTFRRTLRNLNPQDPYQKECLYNTGVTYYILGQAAQSTGHKNKMNRNFEQAKKIWAVYMKLYPEPSPRADDIVAATAYIDSVDENPVNAQAKVWKDLGQKEYYKQNYDKALEYYLKAVQIDPTYDTAYNNIGSVYYFQKNYAKAVEYWERAVLLNPQENKDLYLTMGSVYFQFLKNPVRAAYFLKEHLKLNPKDPQKPQIESLIRSLESGETPSP